MSETLEAFLDRIGLRVEWLVLDDPQAPPVAIAFDNLRPPAAFERVNLSRLQLNELLTRCAAVPQRLPSPEEERATVGATLDVLVGSGFLTRAAAMAMMGRLSDVQHEEALVRPRPAQPTTKAGAMADVERGLAWVMAQLEAIRADLAAAEARRAARADRFDAALREIEAGRAAAKGQ